MDPFSIFFQSLMINYIFEQVSSMFQSGQPFPKPTLHPPHIVFLPKSQLVCRTLITTCPQENTFIGSIRIYTHFIKNINNYQLSSCIFTVSTGRHATIRSTKLSITLAARDSGCSSTNGVPFSQHFRRSGSRGSLPQ
jgi:hypothetical protein